jgi:hypothetical protein
LAEFDNNPEGRKALTNIAVIEKLKPSQLKDMDTMDKATRAEIGRVISSSKTHPAYKYITDNIGVWS